jgi:Ca2+-binding EF-hand superfamily protein
LDRNKDGTISKEELQRALEGLGVPIDAEMAARMVRLIDKDDSADISFEEFRRFAVLLPASQVPERHTSRYTY